MYHTGKFWPRDQLIPAQLEPVADDIDMDPETLPGAVPGTVIPQANPVMGSHGTEAAKL